MKFINFAIIKFSAFLTVGILTAYYFPQLKTYPLPTLLSCFIVLLITWQIAKRKLIQTIYFGLTTYVCFFVIGLVNYQLRQPSQHPNHYFNTYSTNQASSSETNRIQLNIAEVLKADNYNDKYIGLVTAIDGQKKHGKLLLSVTKDTCWARFTVDDQLLISSSISSIAKPKNPHQFNYNEYMKSMGVFGQLPIQNGAILAHNHQTRTLKGYAEKIRSRLIASLKRSGLKQEERVIVQALILGERREISGETKSQYAAAGAIHLLAVSGLHVGIVFMLFRFLFAPLDAGKTGRIIKALLIILLLYGFALLTGLSPSVIRAATMFSLFIFADLINRRTDSINTLFISYFGLLLINPTWLFQIGFQLSYLAVFFILWIQPKLYGYFNPKNYFLKLFWGITTVSIAAQLGVFPLSLYYFHQFPGLFLFTNLVVLPLISLILIGGIIFILLSILESLPPWFIQSYSEVIRNLNHFIAWTADQENFLFKDITFSGWQVLSTYVILISLAMLWKKISYPRIILVLGCFALFFGQLLIEKRNNAANETIIFHKNRLSLLANKQKTHLQIFSSDTSASFRSAYPIKSYYTAVGATSFSEEILPKAFRYKNKTIIVLDSLGVYPKSKHIEIVFLTYSPKVNLERLIDSLKPELIVADGSNYHSFVARWEKTCNEKKLPFHHTGTKGALIFE